MINNKQSSVEWSIDQMIVLCEDYDDGKINYTDYINGVKEVKSQAKVMHKKEIIEFANDFWTETDSTVEYTNAEIFYNKIFKSE